jgi:hypothetical protein
MDSKELLRIVLKKLAHVQTLIADDQNDDQDKSDESIQPVLHSIYKLCKRFPKRNKKRVLSAEESLERERLKISDLLWFGTVNESDYDTSEDELSESSESDVKDNNE